MTTTPEEPLNDGDIESTGTDPSAAPGGDADGTDGTEGGDADGTDGDSTDTPEGETGDADGTDA